MCIWIWEKNENMASPPLLSKSPNFGLTPPLLDFFHFLWHFFYISPYWKSIYEKSIYTVSITLTQKFEEKNMQPSSLGHVYKWPRLMERLKDGTLRHIRSLYVNFWGLNFFGRGSIQYWVQYWIKLIGSIMGLILGFNIEFNIGFNIVFDIWI